jgi:PAS domain S-box-containing protein
MHTKFWQWIRPPVLEQEEQNQVVVWLHLLLLSIAIAAIFIAVTTAFITQSWSAPIIAIVIFVVSVSALWFNRRGNTTIASTIFLFSLLGIAIGVLYFGNGIHDTFILFYPGIVIFGALLLQRRTYIALVVLVIGSLGFIVFAEVNGWIVTPLSAQTDYGDFIVISTFLVVQAVIIALLISGYLHNLQLARRNAQVVDEGAQTLRALLNACKDPMFLIDADAHFLELNEALARTLGRSVTELIGAQSSDLVPPIEEPLRKKIIDEVIRSGQPTQLETHFLGFWFENYLVPILDKQGQVYRIAVYVRDVTSYKKAAEEIRTLNAELEQRVIERTAQLESANKELEAFSYSVSHDLRAPLRAISSFARIVRDDFSGSMDPMGRGFLDKIIASGIKMNQLIDDLLDFSRINRKQLDKQEVGLHALVQSVIESLTQETANRKIEWIITELPVAPVDPVLIQQVYANLIGNAVKYSRNCEFARIEVGSFPQNGEVVYFVRDNGAGFDMRYADRLFGVFQRLHRDEEFEGTGIGLATVQRIIHGHGGRIWAEAEVNKGATFYFTLN